jgi:ABC-2 type transport system permease protein
MTPPTRFLACAWIIARKDLRVWLRHPLSILSSLLVPLSYFLVVFLGAQAVGQNPVAVVNQDRGPVGAEIVRAIGDAQVFRVQLVSAGRAQDLYGHLEVAAIVSIPPDFSQLLAAHQQAGVTVELNNYNLDIANDIRRSVPDAITLYYQDQGAASPFGVTVAESTLRARDIELFQYSILPIIVLIVTVNGVITSGMAATSEWEKRTIKELLLAPCARPAIIAGKVLAGFLGTFSIAMAMLLFGAATNLARPQGAYWLSAVTVIALGSLFSSGLGIAVGTYFQRKQPVSYAATLVAVELFALAGGLGVIFFEPQWLQAIATFDPLTYAIHSLQQAVFYNSFDQFLRDAAVLALASLGAILAGSLAMRREIVVQ